MTDCVKIQELISCLMDGELTAKEKAEVESHIAHCPECRAMYEDFAALGGMMSAEAAEVPAALHTNIMASVKAAPVVKKKKGLLVALRPYMGAAACLVIIVGLVAMMGRDSHFFSASDSAAPMSMPASAPAASAENYSIPAEYDYSLECETAEEPAEAPPEAEEAESGTDYGSTGKSQYGLYAPGSVIDEAVLTTIMTDGSRESHPLTELDKLAEALMPIDFSDPYGAEAIASAELNILSSGEWYTLELCYAGEALIVRQAEDYYFAAATVQEFLEIK